jgi:hypothetical protein
VIDEYIVNKVKKRRSHMRNRLNQNEYAPYYQPYVEMVPDGELIQILSEQREETMAFLKDITDTQGEFCYAEGKWSIKEVIGHMIDTERVMAYRLLAIARGDRVNLPGFDEDEYVQHASFMRLSIDELLQNFSIVRQSTVVLVKSLSDEDWLRWGSANDFEITVRALAVIIAGHELHHLTIIRERYMASDSYPN